MKLNYNRENAAGITAALAILCIVALIVGCGTLHTEYHGVRFDPPGSTNIASRVDGVLTRRALGVKSAIPQFRIGPTNDAVIETSGGLTTAGDSEYVKSLLKGILDSMK